MRFQVNSASATVRPLDEQVGLLMNVRANDKRHGDGTLLMKTVIQWADEEGWFLYLEPRVFERGGIPDNPSLIEWYKKFGFVIDPQVKRNRRMYRYPSRELHGP